LIWDDARRFAEEATRFRFFHVTAFTGPPYEEPLYPLRYLAPGMRVIEVQRAESFPGTPVAAMLIEKPQND